MPVTLYNQSRIKQVGPKKNKPKKKQKNVKSKKSKICKSKKCISKRSKKHKKTVKKIKGGAIFKKKAIFTDEDAFFKLFIDDLLKSLKTQWFFNTSPVLEKTGKKDTIFEEDTIHDGINPLHSPRNFEDHLFYNNSIAKEDEQYGEMSRIFKDDIKVIDRETLLSLDDKYAIFKDYGWGPNLLGLSALLDSASTPSLKKYEAYKKKTSKNCPEDRLCKEENKCRDCDDALTRSDLPLYAYFRERYKTVFPDFGYDPPAYKKKNIILLNFLWYATIAYCAKCSEPANEKQWCHGIQFLFSMFFTNIEEDGSSYIPTCQFINFMEPINISVFNDVSVFTAIKKIRRLFIETKEFGKYFNFNNTDDYKNQLKPTKDKREHSFKFKISQSEIAKKIRSVLRKNCPSTYKSEYIVPRGNESTESTKETIYCIQRITEIFYDTYPDTHMDKGILKKNLVYVLRVLKFCGDRSHLILSKINKIAFENNSNSSYKLRPELLYTGERPLSISTIAEEINGVFEILNVHHNYLNKISENKNSEFKKKFLLYLPKKFIYNEIFFEFEQIFNAFKWNLIKNDITNLSGFLTEEYFFGEKKKPICTVEIIDEIMENDMKTYKEYNICIIKDDSISNLNFEIYENDTLLKKNQEKKNTKIILKPEFPYFEKGDIYFNKKIKDFNEKITDFNKNKNFKDFNNEFKIYKRIMDHVYNKEFFEQLNDDFKEDINSKNTPKIGDLHSSITDRKAGSSWIKYCRTTDIGVSRGCSEITGTKLDPNNIYRFFLYKNGSNICSANSYSIFKRVDKLLDFMIYLLDFVEYSENEYEHIDFVIPVNINPDDDTSTKIDGLPSLGDVSCPKHKKKIHNILINIRNNYLKLEKNKFEINPVEDTLRNTAKDVYNSLIEELLDDNNNNNLSRFFNNTILLTKVYKKDSKYFEVRKFNDVSQNLSGGVGKVFDKNRESVHDVVAMRRTSQKIKREAAGTPNSKAQFHTTLYNKLRKTQTFGEEKLAIHNLIIHTFLKIINMAFKIIINDKFYLNSFSYAIDKLIEDYFYGNTRTFYKLIEEYFYAKTIPFDYSDVTSAYKNLKNLQYGDDGDVLVDESARPKLQEQHQSDNDYFAVVNLNEDYLLNKDIYEKEISSNYIVDFNKYVDDISSDDISSEEFCDYILEVIRPSFEIFEYMYKQNSRKI